MATRANGATAKDGTNTPSNGSALRDDAPPIRSTADLLRKYEQLQDAIDRGVLTPKQIDGMNTTLKAIKALGIDIPLRLMALQVKARQNMPVPRAPMVREFLGLAAKPSASDARLLQEGTAAE